MLISDEYRALNAQMHAQKSDYGDHGNQWAEAVKTLAERTNAYSVLDYGCGKRTLRAALPSVMDRRWYLAEYDPAIADVACAPDPCDLVVCTNVLEHIEPECLEDVLDDIRRCSLRWVFLSIAMVPANKHLPDGRNAHLIQEGGDFWLPKLEARWKLRNHLEQNGWLTFVGKVIAPAAAGADDGAAA